MIVIEGKVGKSVKLQELLNNQLRSKSVVIIDTVGVKGLIVPSDMKHLMITDEDINPAEIFEDIYESEFSLYDWVVFEVNAESLIDYIKLDEIYRQNFIVTLQNNDMSKVELYYV